MGKHGICPLSVAPLRQRIVCIPITPPQCGLSPKETRPSCAAADCCYCACCSSPHRSARCCFCCRSPSLSHRPKHDRPARDDDLPRPASVHCRHTAPPALLHTPRAQSFADCLRWNRNLNRPHHSDAPRASSSAHGPDVRCCGTRRERRRKQQVLLVFCARYARGPSAPRALAAGASSHFPLDNE